MDNLSIDDRTKVKTLKSQLDINVVNESGARIPHSKGVRPGRRKTV